MKIIAFYPGAYPNGFAPMSYRLHYYLTALKSKGAGVEIVMPSEQPKASGEFEGIPYSFVRASKLTRLNRLKIAGEYAAICSSLAKRSDVVFTTVTHNLFLSKIADEVHKVNGKIAIELNENPYSAPATRFDTKPGLFLERQYFLNRTLKKADGIVVISEALAKLVSEYKRKDAVVTTIPILTGDHTIAGPKASGDIPYILHAGALSEMKDGVKAMLQAFAIARERLNGNLKFVFTSKIALPSLLSWIDNFIRDNHLENAVEFRGLVPKTELDELYANCALAIVNKPANAQNNYNFPTKLTELLPREIPVIASRTGVLNDYFTDGINAFMVDPDNVGQITDKIVYILTHTERAHEIARNGKTLAEKEFHYSNYSHNLKEFFENVAKYQRFKLEAKTA